MNKHNLVDYCLLLLLQYYILIIIIIYWHAYNIQWFILYWFSM